MRYELDRPALRPSSGALTAELPELPGSVRKVALKTVMLTFGRLIEVEGAERLGAASEPAIFALNHSNSVESVLAPATLMYLRGRPVHFLADWMYLQIPVLGWLIRLGEPIPVYGKPARWRLREAYRLERRREPVVEACLARLAVGGSLGIFPEGTRNADPARLLRGRAGLGEIVLRSSAPVVPVGLHYPAAERLGRAPRLGRLVLRVGQPMPFREERQEAGLTSGQVRREIARRVVSAVMTELQELSGKTSETNLVQRRVA
ncbi:MAG TPA: lysophospholipid acyltransferase family protein [Thermoanaerobaculia bacterium]|jgi:1-acyl-sn-glycerol-3-phosphate acyltransferase|nr:lysophospholipid acyltransferase family protein [Thermoanaerobaculia bacterium]